MKIVFYSTNSTFYDRQTFHYFYFPKCKTKLEELKKVFPDFDFIIVTQEPGMFLLDLKKSGEFEKANGFEYFILDKNADIFEFSQKILSFSPDFAISITGFYRPFDWQGIKDSLIAKELQKNGVKVLCNEERTQNICFDKNLFQIFLEQNDFNFPKSIYVNHELFWSERNKLEIVENVYKQKIFYELEKFSYPAIIKDTTGLSSFGMEVVNSAKAAKSILLSKKNNGDKVIQNFIQGEHFGVEIYGTKENYTISKPFLFSVNRYGITSPKQSVKIGPIKDDNYKIEELNAELLRLSNLLNINGIAQVDLVFDGKKWFIIEVNPRISGMTNIVCESFCTNIFILLVKKALNQKIEIKQKKVMSVKVPLISQEEFENLKKLNFVKEINQTQNENAKQKREIGYCEIIIDGTNGDFKTELEELKIKDCHTDSELLHNSLIFKVL